MAPNHRVATAAAVMAACALLSSCGWMSVNPWPRAPASYASPPPAAEAAPPAQATVIVRPGETIYSIARANQVPTRIIIEANHLKPPFQLHSGQELMVPRAQIVIVNSGDSIDTLALRYGVDSSALVRANNVPPPYRLQLGQRLVLPGRVSTEAFAANGAGSAASTAAPMNTTPPMASGAGVQSAPTPSGVQVMNLPPPPGTSSSSAPLTRGSSANMANAGPLPTTAPPAAPTGTMAVQPAKRPPASSASGDGQTAALPPAPPPGSARFLWPVQGRILSPFGTKEGGLYNDGINISAPRGQPVVAAGDGVVAYAGNENRGFGNLVLIRHPDGWMTAYAHNDTLLVKRGDQVRRGQPVATVGTTGNVASPQLHFEVRHGSQPVDPTKYLPTLAVSLQ